MLPGSTQSKHSYGPRQLDAVLDLFQPKSLKRAETAIGFTRPSEDFRASLARAVWRRFQDAPPNLKNAKRRLSHLLAKPEFTHEDLEKFAGADPGTAEEQLRYIMLVSGLSVSNQGTDAPRLG
jgi:hypothetical protein